MKIYTMGFTRRSAEDFFETLRKSVAKHLLDIRRHNTSQPHPQRGRGENDGPQGERLMAGPKSPREAARSGGPAPALRLGAFVAVLALLLAACLPASAPPTIKLGLVAPFSGRDAALGYNMLVAAKLAIKEWNDRGGAGGYYVELVAQDDRNDAEMGATQARKMALDPRVVGVIGHPSEASALGAAPVYRQAGLPAVITGAALANGSAGGPPVFELGSGAEEIARRAAAFLAAQGAGQLAVIYDKGPDLGRLVTEGLNRNGREVFLWSTPAETGERWPYGTAGQANPRLVFYDGSYVGGASLISAIRGRDAMAVFLGGPRLAYPDFLKLAGPAAEGTYYILPGPDPLSLEGARSFVEAYRAAAGTDPWPQSLQAYDAVNAMLEGLDRSSGAGQRPGREAVTDALLSLDFQGQGGAIAFDGQGNQAGAGAHVYRVERMTWPGRAIAP